jgi:hypothetical protein
MTDHSLPIHTYENFLTFRCICIQFIEQIIKYEEAKFEAGSHCENLILSKDDNLSHAVYIIRKFKSNVLTTRRTALAVDHYS